MAPTTTKQWTVQGQSGFDSLKLHNETPIPKLSDHDVLVNFKSVSLNYRDLIIIMVLISSHAQYIQAFRIRS